jgi:hypothetical protein
MFQALNLSIFGVFKKEMQRQLPFGSENLSVKSIQPAFRSLKQTFVEDNVERDSIGSAAK